MRVCVGKRFMAWRLEDFTAPEASRRMSAMGLVRASGVMFASSRPGTACIYLRRRRVGRHALPVSNDSSGQWW